MLQPVLQLAWVISGDSLLKQAIMAVQLHTDLSGMCTYIRYSYHDSRISYRTPFTHQHCRSVSKAGSGNPLALGGTNGCISRIPYLGYYSVVAGWTLEFIGEAATNSFAGKSAAEFIASFNGFVSNPWRPVIWLVVFLLATHFIIIKGVEKGIEKSAKIMMPMLFILLVVLAICSVSLPGAKCGYRIPAETRLQQSGR